MDITIVQDRKNPLMNRREVTAEITHQKAATPPRKHMLAGLGKILKAPEDTIIIDKIFTRRGAATCEARVLIYKKVDDIPAAMLEKQKRRLAKSEKKDAGKEKTETAAGTESTEKPSEAPKGGQKA